MFVETFAMTQTLTALKQIDFEIGVVNFPPAIEVLLKNRVTLSLIGLKWCSELCKYTVCIPHRFWFYYSFCDLRWWSGII